MKKILIVIPTYNEVENVEKLYFRIKRLKINAGILFIDDNSPDGTATIIRKISSRDKSVTLISRKNKMGIGSAHLAGIEFAYKKGFKTLITMDSDFTHNPEDILKLLNKKDKANIVIGSRYIGSKSLSGWNIFRKTLTLVAHFLTKKLLKMPYDATSAFRLYNLNKIPKGVLSRVESIGYSFFFESIFILFINGFKITEVSIKLPARTYGTSKMTSKDIIKSFLFLIQTYYLSRTYRDSYIYTPQILIPKKERGKEEIEWDEYWQFQRKNKKILYDSIAIFYRKYIIKQCLNSHIKRLFKPKAKILHAGCGGGQVDSDIINYADITGLDISTGALNLYKRLYKNNCHVIYGSVFNIPADDESFDGVYNLGVMEHFTQKDIKQILDEFNRVLKKDGKIVLFWPPTFGLSVLFLNSLHFILNKVLNKSIRLHPEEITKVKSKKQIESILNKSGFKLKGFTFGPQDLFTYVVIVGQRLDQSFK